MGGLFSRSKKSAPVTVTPSVPELPTIPPNSTFDVHLARSPTYGQCAIPLVIPKSPPAGAGVDYVPPRSPPASVPPRPTLSQRNLNSYAPKPPPSIRVPVQQSRSDGQIAVPPRPTISQRNVHQNMQPSPQSPRHHQQQQSASPSMGQSRGDIPVPPRPTLSQRNLQQQQLQHKPTYTVTQQHSAYTSQQQQHQAVDTTSRFNSIPRRNPQQQLRPKIEVPLKPQPRSPPPQRNGFNGSQSHAGYNNNNRQNGFNSSQTQNGYNNHNTNNYYGTTNEYSEESYSGGGEQGYESNYTDNSYSNYNDNNNYDTSSNYTDNSYYNNHNDQQYTEDNSAWGGQTQESEYYEDTTTAEWGQEEKAAVHQVRATYDYYPQSDRELTFRKGDVITVTTTHPSGWWEGELNGLFGKFPNNHVEEIY